MAPQPNLTEPKATKAAKKGKSGRKGKKDKNVKKVPLEDLMKLKPEEPWYREEGQGTIKVKQVNYRGGDTLRALSMAASVALMLTELCCERGCGKVYVLSPQPNETTNKIRNLAGPLVWALPELLYIPEGWSRTSQQEWRTRSPHLRLHHLQSRHGWIRPEMLVLPFAIDVLPTAKQKRRERYRKGLLCLTLANKSQIGVIGQRPKRVQNGDEILDELAHVYRHGFTYPDGHNDTLVLPFTRLFTHMLEACHESNDTQVPIPS